MTTPWAPKANLPCFTAQLIPLLSSGQVLLVIVTTLRSKPFIAQEPMASMMKWRQLVQAASAPSFLSCRCLHLLPNCFLLSHTSACENVFVQVRASFCFLLQLPCLLNQLIKCVIRCDSNVLFLMVPAAHFNMNACAGGTSKYRNGDAGAHSWRQHARHDHRQVNAC